jgi:hypothetical protein
MRIRPILVILFLFLETASVAQELEAPGAGILSGSAALHGRWTVTDSTDGAAHEFSVPMARIALDWRPEARLRAKLQFDVNQLFKAGRERAALRDAFVELRLHRALRIRMGQFKRPFSALENRGRRRLEIIERGPANEFLIEDLGFGDRDLGLQVESRFGKRKRYIKTALGLFNGPGKNRPEKDGNGAKDVVLRVEGRPLKWMTIGANTSLKFFDQETVAYVPGYSWMAGLDVTVARKGLFFLVEGLYGTNHDRCELSFDPAECRGDESRLEVPRTWSVVATAAYRFPLSQAWQVALEPTLKGELSRPDNGLHEALLWQASLGSNLIFGEHVRVMIHGEVLRAQAGLAARWQDANRLMLQVALRL